VVAAEEEKDEEGAAGDHMGVFGEEVEGEAHRGILGVVAADEFLLALGVVEGGAVGLGEDGDEEDDADKGLAHDEPAVVNLVADDLVGDDGADDEKRGQDGEAEGDLVRDHLGSGPEAAEEGKLVVAGPAAEGDAVHAHGSDGEEIDDADVERRAGDVDGAGGDDLMAEDLAVPEAAQGMTMKPMRAGMTTMAGASVKRNLS